ncbi:hypothetical protein [Acidovorax sp. NB1]|uniref:hypothetical protein n=1 Tax=Acidovorax sp. NB1 TaxID=1943571 RepID=UPI0010EE9F5F|nr:hypothetical protein [Acidovorax sp. NB1]GDY34418.1 hypothetical protein ACINB_03100 [Acidovorax sp. NB1]
MSLQRRAVNGRFDVVVGTAAELVASGIVSMEELPGQPGRNKTMCTYHGTVQLPRGSQVAKGRTSALCGYRQISRRGKDRYHVLLDVGDAEAARRAAQRRAEEDQILDEAAAAVIAAEAPSYWVGRVGLCFAAKVVQRRHLQVV